MKRILPTSLAVMAVVLSTGSNALACEPAPVHEGQKRLRVAEDCSFKNGARNDRFLSYSAEKAVDIGNGRIGQKLRFGTGCGPSERLLFMNCTTGSGVVVWGIGSGDPSYDHVFGTSIARIQHPEGPIGLTRETDVKDVVNVAEVSGFHYLVDLKSHFSRSKYHKRIPYACGCNLYYPDTPGAKS